VLVRGVSDQAFSKDEMDTLAAQLGGPGELHEIAGATHAVNLTHPREVNAVLRRFLDDLR
jgi:3-oxoadipate enol-lactonase